MLKTKPDPFTISCPKCGGLSRVSPTAETAGKKINVICTRCGEKIKGVSVDPLVVPEPAFTRNQWMFMQAMLNREGPPIKQ